MRATSGYIYGLNLFRVRFSYTSLTLLFILLSFSSLVFANFANTTNQLNNSHSIFSKQSQQLLPDPISSAITVNLQNLKDINSQKTIMQYRAGGHIMGFASDRVYVAGMGYALIEEFMGANKVQPVSDHNTQYNSNNQKVPALSLVNYPELYNGISLRYEGRKDGITESFWELEAGVNADAIRIKYNTDFSIQENGSLKLSHPDGQGWFSLTAPVAWQTIKGEKIPVKVAFQQIDNQTLGYHLNDYNSNYAVTIDPVLEWNTFHGSANQDDTRALTIDSSGNIYVTGQNSSTWGTPINAHTGGGNHDIVVFKLNNNGFLQWNTFHGSADVDFGGSLALDNTGNIYVTGGSFASWGTPVNADSGNGGADIVVFKLNNSGALQWNTFHATGTGSSLAVDITGNIYVVGTSFAAWGAPINAYAGSNDIVVFKLNNNGAIQWNTFFGSVNGDKGFSLALDSSNNIYVTGYSGATWGTPVNAHAGNNDIVVFKLNNNGVLQWNTFYGASTSDIGRSLDVDATGNVYVTGYSLNTWGIPINPHAGSQDIVLFKLNNNGLLQWNTFYGGVGVNFGISLVIDSTATLYVNEYSDPTWGTPVNAHAGNNDMGVLKIADTDIDDDSINSSIEDLVPDADGVGTGDGNNDGTQDSTQAHVASLKTNAGTEYQTLVNTANLALSNVTAQATPIDAPAGVTFPYGMISFTVNGVGAGATVNMDIYVPYNTAINSYYKKGNDGQWYDISTAITHIGTIKTKISISLVEGGNFDTDGVNTTLTDPGGPAIFGGANAIPTLSQWMLILLAIFMGLFAYANMSLRNKQH
ncbi:MAG: IPTL-CTERM sorting domain-containing protein [Pseudomonadota bacterium]